MSRQRGVMAPELFKKLVDDIAAKSLTGIVHLYGFGEPYLTPNYLDYCAYAIPKLKRAGVGTNIITNGSVTTSIPQGVMNFIISFNGGNKESYEAITGLDFKQTVANIKRLYKEGQFKNANNVEIHCLIFKDNQGQEQEVLDLFKDVHGMRIRFAYKYDNQRGLIENKTITEYNTAKKLPCHYVFNVLNITWNGEVSACPHDENNQVVYGNVNTHTIEEVCASPVAIKLREKHAKHQFDGICKDCNFNTAFEDKYVYYKNGVPCV